VRRKDLENMLRAVPFVPFRIVMADGRVYEVRHPDMAIAARSTAVVASPDPADPESAEDFHIIALSHINRFEQAGQPAAPAGDRQGGEG
jgi:hypothetical protein